MATRQQCRRFQLESHAGVDFLSVDGDADSDGQMVFLIAIDDCTDETFSL